jgi:hypothetical protein
METHVADDEIDRLARDRNVSEISEIVRDESTDGKETVAFDDICQPLSVVDGVNTAILDFQNLTKTADTSTTIANTNDIFDLGTENDA